MTSRSAILTLLLLAAALPSGAITAQEKPQEKDSKPNSTDQAAQVDPEHARKMAAGTKLFRRQVRPLLVGRCLKCHGGEEIEGGFDLSTREKLLQGGDGGAAVVPGKGRASRLYRLMAHEEEPEMPLDGARIEERFLRDVVQWIDYGAPYDAPLTVGKSDDPTAWTRKEVEADESEFWAFRPLDSGLSAEQVQNLDVHPVDHFINLRLQEGQLKPQPRASQRTLLRRAYFDLTGLPPTADEAREFLADERPKSFELLVDRLLASPHYGERWGRHWLDVARFAESDGFEQDYDRPYAYHFRDFVIRALNADMPYDQFVRWQLAGDELAKDNPLAWQATGFLTAGVFPTQLTEKEFESARYDQLDDMTATVGTAFLGLTVGCARCHDHKFDPIPQADYYRMVATFATAIRSQIDLELDPEETRQELQVWEEKRQPLRGALRKFEQGRGEEVTTWLREQGEVPTADWLILDFTSAISTGGATLVRQEDGSLLATGENPNSDVYRFTAQTNLTDVSAIRLEALPDPSMVKQGPGRATNGNFGLGEIQVLIRPLGGNQPAKKLKLKNPQATFEQNGGNLAIAASLDGNPKTGWAVDPQFGKRQAATFEVDAEQPAGFPGGSEITIELKFDVNTKHQIGRPRLALRLRAAAGFDGVAIRQSEFEPSLLKQQIGTEAPTEEQIALLMPWFLNEDEEYRDLRDRLAELEKTRPQPKMAKVMVTSEGVKPVKHNADGRGFPHFYPETHFLQRGDAAQKQGVASQGFLQVLMRGNEPDVWKADSAESAPTSLRRTAMAKWITDSEQGAGQLLARVAVNRLWHHHFGRGLVATPNDFGFQGRRPTHPLLLDWLAEQLIAQQWRLKPIHKLIMTSEAYARSSADDARKQQLDADNELWWRFESRRLEAEVIRDAVLAVSQQLDRTMFGPGTQDQVMRRRSIYFTVKRSRLIPMMQIFDAPEPLVSIGSRPQTTIAPQALMFMNSPQVRQAAISLSQRLVDVKPESRIEEAYWMTLARAPAETEREAAAAFVARQEASYAADGKTDAAELAWADFGQVLVSLNEFIYLD